MKRPHFVQSTYTGAPNSAGVRQESPYQTWLKVTTEKVLLQFWLQGHLPTFALSKVVNRPIRVLDLGCGFGHMSLRLIRVLLRMGLTIDYTGIDPYQAQLDLFEKSLIPTTNLHVHLLQRNATSFVGDQDYDLVFASHMLYYVSDWHDALKRIASSGREIIIVHHGPRGINTIHKRFYEHVYPGPHVISTDEQVAEAIRLLPLNGKQVLRDRFPSTVAVRSCQLNGSHAGNNLISFFLERPLQEISPDTLKEVRAFMHELYAPDHLMVHDVGVITVR
jgi:ubiquinone/menaquinone biosynthesis C-methylase UbiE